MTRELQATLERVAQIMTQARDDWWVIASAAAALHGVHTPAVGDVDVLVSERDLIALSETLGLKPEPVSPHPLFASRALVRWTEPPMTVELMAGFRVRSGGEWRDVKPGTRQGLRVGGHEVFVPSRTELADLLTAIGRPKDLARAAQLMAGT